MLWPTWDQSEFFKCSWLFINPDELLQTEASPGIDTSYLQAKAINQPAARPSPGTSNRYTTKNSFAGLARTWSAFDYLWSLEGKFYLVDWWNSIGQLRAGCGIWDSCIAIPELLCRKPNDRRPRMRPVCLVTELRDRITDSIYYFGPLVITPDPSDFLGVILCANGNGMLGDDGMEGVGG